MVTDQQIRRLRVLMKKEQTKAITAAKAGMNEKTARKYMNLDRLPSQIKRPHNWRTRNDPFEKAWDMVKSMLETNNGLEAKTIFDDLQRKYPGKYSPGQLRTLQRRIKYWRATEGPSKEIYFPQKHYPGELSESDFTYMNSLKVTINREPFEHMIYHFVLTYSNWETGTICFSESFESLSAGYQNAVWELGGVTKRHRTDRMSAAVNKECNPEVFTARYKALLRHYGTAPERTNPARANENGDVEQRHYRFKNALDQALMLRGSRDFRSYQEYVSFLKKLFDQLNINRDKRLQEELNVLKGLPARRLEDYKTKEVRVGPFSTIHIEHNTYSVHSRLIGEKVLVKICVDYIELWYAQKKVARIPRLKGRKKHRIQYQHVIEWLVRKPGAFKDYKYKTDMFPSTYFRMAYDYLTQYNPFRANKEYVKILHVAYKEGETITESAIRRLLSQEEEISAETVLHLVKANNQLPAPTEVAVNDINLGIYDELLSNTGKGASING